MKKYTACIQAKLRNLLSTQHIGISRLTVGTECGKMPHPCIWLVNVKNDDGDTPLCVLAKHNYCRQEAAFAEIAGLLLSKGARILRSGKNTTALIEAVRNRHFLMADALLMSGNRIDSADSNGDNVLHAICQSAGDIAYRGTDSGFFRTVVSGKR